MFESLTPAALAHLRELETINQRDRTDGTPHSRRLRQISSTVGKLLAMLAASPPAGPIVEIGTSAGYSTVWLALAARASQRRLMSFELDAHKVELARQTFAVCGLADAIELVHGDALEHLRDFGPIAFCFLDAEKNLYQPCYDLVLPQLISGGLLVADNVLSHADALHSFVAATLADAQVDAVVAPIDANGQLICRKK